MLTSETPVPAGAFALMDEKKVDTAATIDYKGYQVKLTNDESFTIRAIAGVDSVNFSKVGYELYIIEAGETVQSANVSTTTVYTAINAYDSVTGDLQDPITAESLDSLYLSAVAIEGIPATGSYTLVIRPYTISADETVTSYGTACVMVIVNGEVVNHYVG